MLALIECQDDWLPSHPLQQHIAHHSLPYRHQRRLHLGRGNRLSLLVLPEIIFLDLQIQPLHNQKTDLAYLHKHCLLHKALNIGAHRKGKWRYSKYTLSPKASKIDFIWT